MVKTFSAQAVWNRIAPRIIGALNATANSAAELAREKAPVRGRSGRARVFKAPASSSLHAFGLHRALKRSGKLRVNLPLTSRGRYELKTGRADFSNSDGVLTLGGRLRGEIHVVPAEGGGPRWVARLVSPTPYAKYMEFGTRHNRAFPYMRPTLAQVRESFRRRMASAAQVSGRAA